jgi:hypothetical protein
MSDDYIGGTAPSRSMPETSSRYSSEPSGSIAQPTQDDGDGATARAKQAASAAGDAGSKVLDEARGGASEVKTEAQQQARELWTQARTELTEQSSVQQQRLAGGLRSFADQLHQMADAPEERGLASDLARQLGDRASGVGYWLEDRGPQDVIEELRSFARRRPGTFVLVAAGAGLLVGRLTRALKDGPPETTTTTSVRTTPGAIRTEPYIEGGGIATTTSAPPTVPISTGVQP